MQDTGSTRVGAERVPRGRPCSVAAALDIIGDRWTLLIVREIHFGNHRFDQIARNTAAPRDRVAVRLRALEEAHLVQRRPYSEHPPRYEYHLTPAGEDLAPVLRALRRWGDSWAVSSVPVVMRHSCGHEADVMAVCRHCGQEIREDDLTPTVTTHGWDLRGPTEGRPAPATA